MVSVGIIYQFLAGSKKPRLSRLPGKACWLGLISLVALQVMAEPQVETRYRYYPVAVDRLASMQAAVEAASPVRRDGKAYHGFTDSQVRWNWWWAMDADGCRISRVASRVSIVYTLPRLLTDSRNFRIRGVWSEWFWALKAHELKHGDHAIAVAREGEAQILAIPPAADCAEVDREASRIAGAWVEELRHRDAEYDRLTDHGERERGAISDHF